jgi:aspartyl-tRNA synthetase
MTTYDIHRSHFANQINETLLGQKVRVGGWIEDTRDIGKLAFVVIRDITGSVQGIATAKEYSKTECSYCLRISSKK